MRAHGKLPQEKSRRGSGSSDHINWAVKIEIYLIGVSLKSIQSHGFRLGKSGISIGDIPSNFA
jgi:hypothetical protein